MRRRQIIVILLLLCLTLPWLSLESKAAGSVLDGWNIMFVVDGSGSLVSRNNGQTPTDPNGLRYEAVNAIIDMLPEEGSCNAGAIVFSANPTKDASDANMRQCILLNTGLSPISGRNDKRWLEEQIQSTMARSSGGATDFCTALMVAQEILANANNGKPSAIFLFTDGKLALNGGTTEKQALENGHAAAQAISATLEDGDPNNDIKLCGVFLNNEGKVTSTLLKELVRESLGNLPASSALEEHYVEIRSADDMFEATEQFARILGIDIPTGTFVITDSQDFEFRVPGVGVSEAQIYVRSVKGHKLPEQMAVTITRPDGSSLTTAEMGRVCYSSSYYQLYKLKQPESGLWKGHIELPLNNEVGIMYKPIMFYDIDAEMEVTPSANLHVNSDITIDAYLAQGGVRLTDPRYYQEYTCQAVFTDLVSGQETVVDIPKNANGSFQLQTKLDQYTTLEAKIVFNCGDEIHVFSDAVVWDLNNHVPTCVGRTDKTIRYGLLSSGEATLDLSEPKYGIHDVEDPFDDLTIRIVNPMAGVSLSLGGELTISAKDNKALNGQTVELEISDTQGAATTLRISVETRNTTTRVLTIAGILLALVLAILIIVIRIINMTRTSGFINLTIEIPDEDGMGGSSDVELIQLPPPGGGEIKRKTSLYNLLTLPGEGNKDDRRRASTEAGVDPQVFEKTVESMAGELSAAKFSCQFLRDEKTKKLTTNKLVLNYKGSKQTLLMGSSATLKIGSSRIIVVYTGNSDIGDGEEDFYGETQNEFVNNDPYDHRSGSDEWITSRDDDRPGNSWLDDDDDDN